MVIALGYVAITRDGIGACVVAVTIASHYGLDYFTGIKPTWPGGPAIGLDLYERPAIDLMLEGFVILAGWLLYRRTLPRHARNDALVYVVLFSLLAFQVIAGIAFFLNAGRPMKC